ncbi:MAG: AmmeMemoRadiSam system radical SAM enzyme [Bacteroides sp.]|jgi:pyruvate formate lyase activating enzyme|nr:AmmeMemoRadiSam system radical SAM enzyme [Bacteroides sp.]
MEEARHYTHHEDGTITCKLCPNFCRLEIGDTGLCHARRNILGRLIAENYGRITALHLDPIEKKPLYHFFPGHQILSAGSFGCNFHCGWCQNSSISQAGREAFSQLKPVTPRSLAEKAIASGGIGLAYTYNEPTVWFEFMLDTAVLMKEAGLKNVVVTNGYIQPEPLEDLLQQSDAFNVDLKAFSPDFYRKQCGASLDIIKKNLLVISRKGAHLEITFLAIPGLNDDLVLFQEMIYWITGELGEHTPLHISRYFPSYRTQQPPAPFELLKRMYEIASQSLYYVYIGNVQGRSGMNATRCPGCGSLLSERNRYATTLNGIDSSGHCERCGKKVFVF